jgi:Zn-dependent protease
VAYWGGDKSVRQKGYLAFNPLTYIHPVTSILLPCIFLAMGGVALPGGAVMIDESALKNRKWSALVSAAGPASNILMFLLLAVVLHPAVGLVNTSIPPDAQPNVIKFLGALAVLQVFATLLNLLPVPPLDGFGIIEPFLDYETRRKLSNPRFRFMGLVVVFFVFFNVPAFMKRFVALMVRIIDAVGLPREYTLRYFFDLLG